MLEFLRKIAPFTAVALLLALGYLAWVFLSRRTESPVPAKPAAVSRAPQGEGGAVTILQFYAYPAVLNEGERGSLCYGARNAASIRIEPVPEPVEPALNRCFPIEPEETTRYSMTATGADGKVVTASFVLQVAPDPDKQPKVVYFTKGRKQKDGDQIVQTLCFETRNAREVSIEPRVFPPGPLFRGCFYVAPPRTTTYRLTVEDGRGRKDARSVTVEVP